MNVMPDSHHEHSFVEAFIVPERRDRYKLLLANPKRRRAFLNRLNHNLDFIPSLAQLIPGNQHSVEGVAKLLRQRGMRSNDIVYVFSDMRDIDGLLLPLREALEKVIDGEFGSVVSCMAGQLAYYRPEVPASGCILEKAPAPGRCSGPRRLD
jgi:hypothetical protein